MIKGILNINKCEGWTSQDVVSKARRILNERQIGHMGTLDPQGTGVLILGVGKATRLFSFFLNKDKVYEAEFEFGYETDTLDKDGKITKTTQIIPACEEILKAVKAQEGKIMQIPPAYSAKSVDGERAYKKAMRGEEVKLKECEVEIFEIVFKGETKKNTYKFWIHCSSGTYIRSICRDLAYSLNSLATMVSIVRLRAGEFLLENSVTLDELLTLKEKALIPLEEIFAGFRKTYLPENLYTSLINGVKIPFADTQDSAIFCKGELFGIGKSSEGILKIETYLRD